MGEKKAEVPVGKELVRMTGIMKEFPCKLSNNLQ